MGLCAPFGLKVLITRLWGGGSWLKTVFFLVCVCVLCVLLVLLLDKCWGFVSTDHGTCEFILFFEGAPVDGWLEKRT